MARLTYSPNWGCRPAALFALLCKSTMKRNSRTAASGLSIDKTRAIGQMTINFNWMEHSIEVLIRLIVSDSAERMSLIEQALKPLGFRQKLQVLRGLVADLPDHHVKSAELDRAYAEF